MKNDLSPESVQKLAKSCLKRKMSQFLNWYKHKLDCNSVKNKQSQVYAQTKGYSTYGISVTENKNEQSPESIQNKLAHLYLCLQNFLF